MKKTSLKFKIVDAFYITMMILPILVAIVIQVLTKPASEGISISGARIYFTIPMPIQDMPITESQVNSLFVLIVIFFLCLYFTHGLKERMGLKRHLLGEIAVEKVNGLVEQNMGKFFSGYAPFVIAILVLSVLSSLISLFGLYPPTSDINIVGGWAILVFALITFYKLKGGLLNYLKGFTEPIFILTPLNILGEVATPVSLAFRHYGNVLSGSVISVLLATALGGLSSMVLGSLPGFLADIPLFQVGIPGVLSIYFDVFSGCMQAFIFAMLTMLNISGGFDEELYNKRKQKKAQKALKNK